MSAAIALSAARRVRSYLLSTIVNSGKILRSTKFSLGLKYGVQGILESQHWSPSVGDKTLSPERVVFSVRLTTGIGI